MPSRTPLVAVLLVALALLAAGGLFMSRDADPPAYTVSSLYAAIGRDLAAWDGRVVRVRGYASPIFVSVAGAMLNRPPDALPVANTALSDTEGGAYAPHHRFIRLRAGQMDRARAFLRRLPLLGRLAPRPQALHYGTVATYRLRLDSRDGACRPAPCLAGTLLDAVAPPAPVVPAP